MVFGSIREALSWLDERQVRVPVDDNFISLSQVPDDVRSMIIHVVDFLQKVSLQRQIHQ